MYFSLFGREEKWDDRKDNLFEFTKLFGENLKIALDGWNGWMKLHWRKGEKLIWLTPPHFLPYFLFNWERKVFGRFEWKTPIPPIFFSIFSCELNGEKLKFSFLFSSLFLPIFSPNKQTLSVCEYQRWTS